MCYLKEVLDTNIGSLPQTPLALSEFRRNLYRTGAVSKGELKLITQHVQRPSCTPSVASLAKGYSIGEALRNGNINSSSVISQFGAKPGLLGFDEIEKRAANVPAEMLKVFEL